MAVSWSLNTISPRIAASGRELCCMEVPTAKPARRMATSRQAVASTWATAPVEALSQKASVRWTAAPGVTA